jgi:hypothetical protein
MQGQLYLASMLLASASVLGCGLQAKSLLVGEEPRDAGALAEVGAADAGGSLDASGTDASAPETGSGGALRLGIQNAVGRTIPTLTFPCPGACAEIEAVAVGGSPPYSFTWEDGSTSAKRRVCPSTSGAFSVIATDSSSAVFEQHSERQSAIAQVRSIVLECADAAASEGGASQFKECSPSGPTCQVGSGIVLPEDLTVDVPGASVRYFAGGAALPAGRYRLTYVDGCNTYGIGIGWTVHGGRTVLGVFSCSLIGDDGNAFAFTPGTELYPDAGIGEVYVYADCVAANCSQAPLDFDFAGGRLGILRDGGGVLGAIDDLGGEYEGGRSPTFRLSLLDACP